jgi:peptidoglycan/xylan/chitin deacetylase (PgdA/CDA1 family)
MGRHSQQRTGRSAAVIAVALVLSAGVLVVAGVGAARWRTTPPSLQSASLATADPGTTLPASAEQTAAAPSLVLASLAASTTSTSTETTSVSQAQLATNTVASVAATVPAAPPALPNFSAERYLGKPVRFVPNRKNEVAITLDDGPGPDSERVLEILREHEAKATFFVVGRRVRHHPGAVRAMASQGHEVANHTWTHPEPGALTELKLAKEFDRNQKYIKKLTGQEPRFARTRGGKFTGATMDSLTERGLVLALWSIHSNDVAPSPSPAQIVRNATGGVTSGSIILLHETNPNSIEALPAILEALERKGMHPVTLSQLLADDARGTD